MLVPQVQLYALDCFLCETQILNELNDTVALQALVMNELLEVLGKLFQVLALHFNSTGSVLAPSRIS